MQKPNLALSLALGATLLWSPLQPIVGPNSAAAEAADFPARCSYVYASAGYRFADMVHTQINSLEASRQLSLAQQAASLSRELQCPSEGLIKVIDCTLERVMKSAAAKPEFIDVLECVEQSTGMQFPKITEK